MNSDFIVNNVILEICDDESNGSVGVENLIDLCIKVCNFKIFVECLYSDVRCGEFFNVFGNKVLKYFFVLKVFIGLMEKEFNEEFYFVFLLEL